MDQGHILQKKIISVFAGVVLSVAFIGVQHLGSNLCGVEISSTGSHEYYQEYLIERALCRTEASVTLSRGQGAVHNVKLLLMNALDITTVHQSDVQFGALSEESSVPNAEAPTSTDSEQCQSDASVQYGCKGNLANNGGE